MQVPATQLQDAPLRTTQRQDAAASQLEALRARSRELRLRTSDLSAREQQIRELRHQSPPGPERAKVDKQWLEIRHDVTAATLELEGVNERIAELRAQQNEARSVAMRPPPGPERPPVETSGIASLGVGMLILFVGPILLVLVYRMWTRGSARDPVGIETSPRLQRMELAIETIAMEVERLAEGQRFTTRILAERHPESANGAQTAPRQEPDAMKSR